VRTPDTTETQRLRDPSFGHYRDKHKASVTRVNVKNMVRLEKCNGSASCVRGQSITGATDGPSGHWVGGDVKKLAAHPHKGAQTTGRHGTPSARSRASGRPVGGWADVWYPETGEKTPSRRNLLSGCDVI